MVCLPFPASCSGVCDCTCSLVCVLEDSIDTCKVDTSVRLVYHCAGLDYDQDLDTYGVMARVTGDDGILWEGPASGLPAQFSATASDGFELYAWVTVNSGGYGLICSGVPDVTLTHTVSPSCKTCPPPAICECLDGDFVSVPAATVTVTGSPVATAYSGAFCSNPTPTCGSLAGTYSIDCNGGSATWYGIYTFLCSSGGVSYYYFNSLVVTNDRTGVLASLRSFVRDDGGSGLITPGVIVSGSGSGPFATTRLTSERPAITYPCDTGSPVNIATCALGTQTDTLGTIPTSNACDLSSMTIAISR
jgi:hypothetical protein